MDAFVTSVLCRLRDASRCNGEVEKALWELDRAYGARYWEILEDSLASIASDASLRDAGRDGGTAQRTCSRLARLEDSLMLADADEEARSASLAELDSLFGHCASSQRDRSQEVAAMLEPKELDRLRSEYAGIREGRRRLLGGSAEEIVSECERAVELRCERLGCSQHALRCDGRMRDEFPEEVFAFWVASLEREALEVPYAISLREPERLVFTGLDEQRLFAACRCVASSWICGLPPQSVEVVWLDPVSMGRSLGGLAALVSEKEGSRAFSFAANAAEIKSELKSLHGKMRERALKLREHASVGEHNASAGEDPIPHTVLIALGVDGESYDGECVDILSSIADNACAFGVQMVFGCSARPLDDADGKLGRLLDGCVFVEEEEGACIVRGMGERLRARFPEETWWVAALSEAARRVRERRDELTGQGGGPLSIPFATSDDGRQLSLDFGGEFVHAIAAGSSGSGKSVFLHNVIESACSRFSPDDLELWLVDYKKTEFGLYRDEAYRFPHIRFLGLDGSPDFVKGFLKLLDDEFEERQRLVLCKGARDIEEYNALAGKGERRLPRLLVMIDEFHRQSDCMRDDALGLRVAFEHILRESRAYGMHVLIADQTLSGLNGLTDAARKQVGGRILFKWVESSDFVEMFGKAESVEGPSMEAGDAVVRMRGELVRCKSRFVRKPRIRSSCEEAVRTYGTRECLLHDANARAAIKYEELTKITGSSLLLGEVPDFSNPEFRIRLDLRNRNNLFFLAAEEDPSLSVVLLVALGGWAASRREIVVVGERGSHLLEGSRCLWTKAARWADVAVLDTHEAMCAYLDGPVENATIILLEFEEVANRMEAFAERSGESGSRMTRLPAFRSLSPEARDDERAVEGDDGGLFDVRPKLLDLLEGGGSKGVFTCWVADRAPRIRSLFPSALSRDVSFEALFPHRFAAKCGRSDSYDLGMRDSASGIPIDERGCKLAYVGRGGDVTVFKPYVLE